MSKTDTERYKREARRQRSRAQKLLREIPIIRRGMDLGMAENAKLRQQIIELHDSWKVLRDLIEPVPGDLPLQLMDWMDNALGIEDGEEDGTEDDPD